MFPTARTTIGATLRPNQSKHHGLEGPQRLVDVDLEVRPSQVRDGNTAPFAADTRVSRKRTHEAVHSAPGNHGRAVAYPCRLVLHNGHQRAGSTPWVGRAPYFSAGYGTSQPSVSHGCSSDSYSSRMLSAARRLLGHSISQLCGRLAGRLPAHFRDAVHAFLRWSNVALKSVGLTDRDGGALGRLLGGGSAPRPIWRCVLLPAL